MEFRKLRIAWSVALRRTLIVWWRAQAAIPWLIWSKQFSLRTLLIVLTLLRAGLGWIVYASKN
jgi:hypothetical protein